MGYSLVAHTVPTSIGVTLPSCTRYHMITYTKPLNSIFAYQVYHNLFQYSHENKHMCIHLLFPGKRNFLGRQEYCNWLLQQYKINYNYCIHFSFTFFSLLLLKCSCAVIFSEYKIIKHTNRIIKRSVYCQYG